MRLIEATSLVSLEVQPKSFTEVQDLVGGLVEFVYLPDDMLLAVHEEGLYVNEPILNLLVKRHFGVDVVGTCVLGTSKEFDELPYVLN